MVQPYPTAAQMPDAERPSLPASVRNAATAMYVGAAVGVVHAIIYILTRHSIRAAYAKAHPHLAAAKITSGYHVLLFGGVIDTLIGAVLFIWIARMCLRGRNWARITGTVFFGIAVLGALGGLRLAVSAPDKIISFVIVLVGLVAVILLWQRSSSDYFGSSSEPVS
jgi:hypothetical protein